MNQQNCVRGIPHESGTRAFGIRSYPIGGGSDEAERGEEILRELVVSRGDAVPILEAAEAAFDDVGVLVGSLVVADFLSAVGLALSRCLTRDKIGLSGT